MDLLERASALATCPLFEGLAPVVLIRLAERAHPGELAPGERRTTDDTVWIVVSGSLAVCPRDTTADMTADMTASNAAKAAAGNVIGMVRVIRTATPVVELVAHAPTTLIALAVDDVRDVLEEDPGALAALAERLARLLLSDVP